jgi:hypothetical protein
MMSPTLLLIAFLMICAMLAGGAKLTEKQAKYLRRVGSKFLAETSRKEGVIILKSGMLVEILKTSDKPDAKSPKKTDATEVEYKGTLKDGTVFDSGKHVFPPHQVIKVCVSLLSEQFILQILIEVIVCTAHSFCRAGQRPCSSWSKVTNGGYTSPMIWHMENTAHPPKSLRLLLSFSRWRS